MAMRKLSDLEIQAVSGGDSEPPPIPLKHRNAPTIDAQQLPWIYASGTGPVTWDRYRMGV